MRVGLFGAKMALLGAVVAATAAGLAPAKAQPFEGPYINLQGGYNYRDEVRTSYPQATATGTSLHLYSDDGFVGVLSTGYGFGNGFRFEVEGDYRRNDIRHLSGTAFPAAASGSVYNFGGMGNVFFDSDIGLPWVFPYAGVGAGYQWTRFDGVNVVGAPGTNGAGASIRPSSDGDPKFAFQAMVGASFPIPGVPGLSATAEYRFLDITGGEKYTVDAVLPAGLYTAGNPRLKLSNQYNHSGLVGIRYAFGVTPPAPVPAPPPIIPPAPTRSYLVFFDWDKATLTTRARQIVREAADASQHVQTTRIEVNGYTDTSGTPKYNQGLSIRRADAVAAELVRDGVPKGSISIQGFGETHLLVPTGDGVREPQNRRVEIILR